MAKNQLIVAQDLAEIKGVMQENNSAEIFEKTQVLLREIKKIQA